MSSYKAPYVLLGLLALLPWSSAWSLNTNLLSRSTQSYLNPKHSQTTTAAASNFTEELSEEVPEAVPEAISAEVEELASAMDDPDFVMPPVPHVRDSTIRKARPPPPPVPEYSSIPVFQPGVFVEAGVTDAVCEPENAENQCKYYLANAACWSERKRVIIDYKHFYYCTMGGSSVAIPLLLMWSLVIFQVLNVAANDFFGPAVETISDMWQLPPHVAGATLLSFGNGAPDVFTQIAAVTQGEKPDVPLALSSVLGSGLFILFVVQGVVLNSTKLEVRAETAFVRDMVVYAISIMIIFGIMFDGTVELWQSILLGSFYTGYLCYVVFGGEAGGDGDDEAGGELLESGVFVPRPVYYREFGLHSTFVFLREKLDWENLGTWGKIMAPISLPVKLAMMLTMTDGEEPGRAYGSVLAVCGPVFFLAALGIEPGEHSKFFFLLSSFILLFAAVYATSGREMLFGDWFLPALSFMQSILWMKLGAASLVEVLEVLGYLLGFSSAFLGATVLAWGSSVADLVANVAVAKKQPQMALTACVAGPLFNLLVGLSTSLGTQNVMTGPIAAPLDNALLLMLGFSLAGVAYSAAAVPYLHGWTLSRTLGKVLVVAYAAFTVVFTLTKSGVLFRSPWLGTVQEPVQEFEKSVEEAVEAMESNFLQ